MALNNAVLTWNHNVESDLVSYTLRFGLYPGLYTHQVGVAAGLNTRTLISTNFISDGTWFFTLSATDTSSNESGQTAPVSKRVVRTANQLKVRR